MRKMLRACVLVFAIASIAQAGEIQNDRTSNRTDTGTAILIALENFLFLF